MTSAREQRKAQSVNGEPRPHGLRLGRARRVFESLWTLEPEEVRDAARAGAEIVAGHVKDVAVLLDELDTPVSPPAGLRHATDVFSRVLQHVDRLR